MFIYTYLYLCVQGPFANTVTIIELALSIILLFYWQRLIIKNISMAPIAIFSVCHMQHVAVNL